MKKILVITASPRRNGNCSILSDAFIKGANDSGHEVVKFEAGRKKISGCMACGCCWKNNIACVQNDDFNQLAKLLPYADIIVYVSPLYYSDVSAQLKCVIDRQYAFSEKRCPVSINTKGCIMMVCGETEEHEDFKGIDFWYRRMLYYKGWNNLGTLYVDRVSEPGDIKGDKSLEEARALGRSIK